MSSYVLRVSSFDDYFFALINGLGMVREKGGYRLTLDVVGYHRVPYDDEIVMAYTSCYVILYLLLLRMTTDNQCFGITIGNIVHFFATSMKTCRIRTVVAVVIKNTPAYDKQFAGNIQED